MRIGQTVHLKFAPETWGTVSAVAPGQFRVTWFTPDRKTGAPRVRWWYPDAAATTFIGTSEA